MRVLLRCLRPAARRVRSHECLYEAPPFLSTGPTPTRHSTEFRNAATTSLTPTSMSFTPALHDLLPLIGQLQPQRKTRRHEGRPHAAPAPVPQLAPMYKCRSLSSTQNKNRDTTTTHNTNTTRTATAATATATATATVTTPQPFLLQPSLGSRSNMIYKKA